MILVRNNQIGVIQTPKGLFLLGGGLEENENHIACIERECLEEAGCKVSVQDKVCSAESYYKHQVIGYFHPIQTYYIGKWISNISEPIEKDHVLLWLNYDELKGNLFLDMQNWALEQCINYLNNR